MRILIVEDNTDLADLVKRGLHQAGFNCDVVGTTEEARGLMASNAYALISLDLGLPGEDGLTFLKGLREARNPVPVLIITARSSISDRVDGLRSGADDYLVKPFALEELVARVEALLRRPHQLDDLVLTVGNITFHARQRMVSVGGKPCLFSARELSVLESLMRRRGKVVSKTVIEDELFGWGGEVSSNAVEVYVHRLRKQLQEYAATAVVHTIRGVGYSLIEPK